jgi:hypothetical protein
MAALGSTARLRTGLPRPSRANMEAERDMAKPLVIELARRCHGVVAMVG